MSDGCPNLNSGSNPHPPKNTVSKQYQPFHNIRHISAHPRSPQREHRLHENLSKKTDLFRYWRWRVIRVVKLHRCRCHAYNHAQDRQNKMNGGPYDCDLHKTKLRNCSHNLSMPKIYINFLNRTNLIIADPNNSVNSHPVGQIQRKRKGPAWVTCRPL